MIATVESLFVKLFDRDRSLQRARELGAVKRVRALHPLDVMLSVVRCAVGDEHRSVATARRQYQELTGFMPEESSFYDRLTPGMASLTWEAFLQTIASANRVQRKGIARALGVPVRDIRVVDASSVTLPARASAHFPSTHALGGFKITATLSLLEDLLVKVRVTDARQHDRKAFKLPRALRQILWLKDRGYSDHRLFADIADGGGFFIIRLKATSKPSAALIRSGLDKAHLGQPLTRDLPFNGVVDVDARFNVGRRTRLFRVIAIPVANKRGESDWVWLATNLPTRVAATTVGTFYRLRWTIENLFRVVKSVGRLDEVRSGNRAVVQVFIAATLLGLALSQCLCALMRAARPGCEPSLHRVFALLLANFTHLFDGAGNGTLRNVCQRFVEALWREGLNPNPGRPYALLRHLATVGG